MFCFGNEAKSWVTNEVVRYDYAEHKMEFREYPMGKIVVIHGFEQAVITLKTLIIIEDCSYSMAFVLRRHS